MSVTVDAVTGAATATTAGSLSWTHTVGAGATLALVAVEFNDGARAVTAMTFGGTAMTQVPSSIGRSGTSNTDRHVELWSLVSPASGSQTVSVTINGTSPSIAGESKTYFGSSTSAPLGTAAAAGGTSTSQAVTVTGVAGGLIETACASRASAPTAPSGATNVNQQLASTNMFGATASSSATGSTTLTWTQSSSDVIAVAAVPVLPSTASVSSTGTITLGGSPAARASAGDAGQLTLGGAAASLGPNFGGVLTLGAGAAPAQARAAAAGALTLAGAAAPQSSPAATVGVLALGGSSAARAPASAVTGSITLGAGLIQPSFRFQVWTGTAWKQITPLVWNGSSWAAIKVTVTPPIT